MRSTPALAVGPIGARTVVARSAAVTSPLAGASVSRIPSGSTIGTGAIWSKPCEQTATRPPRPPSPAPADAGPGSTRAAPSSPRQRWTARLPGDASRSSATGRGCGRQPSQTPRPGPPRDHRRRECHVGGEAGSSMFPGSADPHGRGGDGAPPVGLALAATFAREGLRRPARAQRREVEHVCHSARSHNTAALCRSGAALRNGRAGAVESMPLARTRPRRDAVNGPSGAPSYCRRARTLTVGTATFTVARRPGGRWRGVAQFGRWACSAKGSSFSARLDAGQRRVEPPTPSPSSPVDRRPRVP